MSTSQTIQQAFGLSFDTADRPLQELAPAQPAQEGAQRPLFPTIQIRWQDTPKELPAPYFARGLYQARPDAFLLDIPDVASYHVDKQAITISPKPGVADETVRLFLFGSAVGALLHMHGILALHGSAVRLPHGGAAVFTGASTAGKSTLATALGLRGHPSLADDIVAVHFDAQGRPWVHPGLSRTKLWNDALAMLSVPYHPSQQVRPDLNKYSVPIETWGQAEPLTHLYELLPAQGGDVAFKQVKGLDKLRLLDRQTFRAQFIQAMDLKSAHVQRLGKLVPQLEIAQISRPLGRPTLDEIIEGLQASWG